MDEERQSTAAQVQYVETVDEEELPADSARRLSRNHKSLNPDCIAQAYCWHSCSQSHGFLCMLNVCMLLSLVWSCHAALFYAGFALLPWLWFSNIWLFWPQLWSNRDQHVRKCASFSGQKSSRYLLDKGFSFWCRGILANVVSMSSVTHVQMREGVLWDLWWLQP